MSNPMWLYIENQFYVSQAFDFLFDVKRTTKMTVWVPFKYMLFFNSHRESYYLGSKHCNNNETNKNGDLYVVSVEK